MNAYPSWIHRIPEMIEALALVESERIDRRAAELLFGLRRTAAKQLLKRMGAQTCGHSLVISRGLLMARLREAHENPDWRWELERRARVEHALLDVRNRSPRPTVIPVSEWERQQLHSQSIAGLPPAIRIAPGELRISFSSADDLLRHLMLLLQPPRATSMAGSPGSSSNNASAETRPIGRQLRPPTSSSSSPIRPPFARALAARNPATRFEACCGSWSPPAW